MDLLYFVLLVSVLIFIHEAGHFAAAKTFGVKVLTFSIGFGPRLLRFRGKETEYCLAAFPLGGFVRMLEEAQATEEILPEDRPRTFEAQALWKRAIIVMAGPAMNVLFPVVLYTSVFLEERTVLPSVVGMVQPGKPAEGKLFPGDRIVAIDGKAIGDFPAQQSVVAQNAGKPLRVSVERDGKALDLRIIPAEESLEREFDIVERVGRLGVSPHFAAAVIGISDKESPAYRAGLRTFDKIISVNGRRVERFVDLMTVLASNRGDSVNLSYLRPVAARSEDSTLWDLAVYEPGVATLTPSAKLAGTTLSVEDGDSRAQDVMTRTGIESSEMYAAFVPQGSSEWQAGLRSGDRIFRLDGVVQRSWLALEDELRKGASRQRTLEWTRGGRPMAGTFQVRREQWEDDYGQHYERVVFRTTHWVPLAPDKLIAHPHPLFFAIRRAFQETANVLRFIGLGLWRALQGRLDFASVSGPITIYDIAGQAGARGPTHFVWAMAVVSVNLGLLNMLPIPVLDGGHMLFLGIEALGRKRVSKRIREMASLVGMGLLATMLLMAIANDVWRRWDVIVREAHRFLG